MKHSKYVDPRLQKNAYYKQKYIDETSDGKCQLCDEVFPTDVIDFHHIDPSTKEFGIGGHKWSKLYPSGELLTELDKCAILCKNCHALEHVALKRGESILTQPDLYRAYRNHRVRKPDDL